MQQPIEECKQSKNTNELHINSLHKTLVALIEKVDKLSNRLEQFSDLPRKITEIHKLHFPEFVQKEEDLTKRFLAEIILGIPRKRKKRKVI
ncbi:hypothetical protein AQF98_12985 [Pedobacter sp. Hv1]|nr:hypothetical protein AQF98_12985 [Pedobacter sp. Hv1]